MEKKNIYLIAIAVIICIALGCLSPFIASGNPDGLEKTASDVNASEGEAIFESPFPDYTFESLGTFGEIIVLIIGALIVLLIGFGAGALLKKKKE